MGEFSFTTDAEGAIPSEIAQAKGPQGIGLTLESGSSPQAGLAWRTTPTEGAEAV